MNIELVGYIIGYTIMGACWLFISLFALVIAYCVGLFAYAKYRGWLTDDLSPDGIMKMIINEQVLKRRAGFKVVRGGKA